jgi:hypothetical protein
MVKRFSTQTIVAFAVAAIVAPSIASAVNTTTWQQRSGYGATSNFNDSRNWTPNVVPNAQNNIRYDGQSSSQRASSNVNVDATVDSMEVTSLYTGTISIQSSRTLTVMNSFDNRGRINVGNGTLDLRALNGNFVNHGQIIESGSGKVLSNVTQVMVTDSLGAPIGEVDLGDEFFIFIADADENLNGASADTTTVRITNLNNLDTEVITLTETGVATGEFTNQLGVITSSDVASVGNGILEGEAGDALSIEYADDEDSADVFTMEIIFHTDCNVNAVAQGQMTDCNNNLVSDACEFARGCPGITLGDMNCDEGVDGGDIQNFVNNLVGGSYMCQVDMNQDGNLNEVDMMSFVDTLLRP